MSPGLLFPAERRRIGLAAVSIVVVAVLALPAITGSDGFPVSTHPMYASARSADAVFVTAVGVAADGSDVALGIGTIAATDDPLVARSRLLAAARNGDLESTCAAIAGRVGDGRIVHVDVIEVRHDVVEFVSGERTALDRTQLARCPVDR